MSRFIFELDWIQHVPFLVQHAFVIIKIVWFAAFVMLACSFVQTCWNGFFCRKFEYWSVYYRTDFEWDYKAWWFFFQLLCNTTHKDCMKGKKDREVINIRIRWRGMIWDLFTKVQMKYIMKSIPLHDIYRHEQSSSDVEIGLFCIVSHII